MERSFDASHPSPAAPIDPAATGRYPSWFILDKKARFTDCDNDTTAEAMTSTGRTIKFTFCLAPPPALSHVCVHETDTHHEVQADVMSSAKDLVLLRRNIYSKHYYDEGEYFVYQAAAVAGDGRSRPSLTPIPCTTAKLVTLSPCATILPLDGEQFLLADLTMNLGLVRAYHLHVFSSKTCVWSTRTLPLQIRSDDKMERPEKVIALGGTVLGWVIPGGGVVVCDVLGKDPVGTRFIPLPRPNSNPREWPPKGLLHRDVAYCGEGIIKFVDLDLRFRHVTVDSKDETRRVIKMAQDLDYADTILDSELLIPEGVYKADTVRVPDGWKIRTCYRHISWDHWRKGHIVDVEDIALLNLRHDAMLPEFWDEDVGRWTLRKLAVDQPTLSIHGDDMVYLKMESTERRHDKQVWIIGLDLGKKTVEMLEPYHKSHVQPFMLSQYLNTPPSAEEIVHAANGAQNNHLSSGCVTQNKQ